MKKILSYSRPSIGRDEKKEILKTLSSDWLSSGPQTLKFEEMLSDYTGAKYVKALNSCTSALELAVLSCGLREGQEVVTTAFTFCSAVNAIIHNRLKPVFADIDKDTFNISPSEIERKISRRTGAILTMDYGGLPCDMDRIMKLAGRYRLKVIDDAAHAIGAEYKGRKIGTLSDLTCFSFHAVKNITTGEGGAIATDNKKTIEFIRKVYFHGIDRESWQRHKNRGWEYSIIYPGFKYNLSDICASLGLHQLKKLDGFIAKRAESASLYDRAFKDNQGLKLQSCPYKVKPAYHLYPIVLNTDYLKIDRDQFIKSLKDKGIIASVHFIPIYKHPAYKRFFNRSDIRALKNTEYISNRILSLPLHPRLSIKDVDFVISAVNKIIGQNRR